MRILVTGGAGSSNHLLCMSHFNVRIFGFRCNIVSVKFTQYNSPLKKLHKINKLYFGIKFALIIML